MTAMKHNKFCPCANCQKARDQGLEKVLHLHLVRKYGPHAMAFGLLYLACWLATNADSFGWISHNAETTITAESNWFVGESKECHSFIGPEGNALAHVDCGKGADHRMKIIFYGREKQPEYALINWKCTRTENSFTCLETSGWKAPAVTVSGNNSSAEVPR